MALEEEVARDGKKSFLVIGLVIFILGAVAFIVWGWLYKVADTPSQISLGNVANNATVKSPESSGYRDLLKTANTQGAQQADTDGNSFVASLSVSDTTPPQVNATPPLVSLDTTTPVQPSAAPVDTGADKRRQQLDAYLTTLSKRWQPAGIQVAGVPGGGGGASPTGTQGNAFSSWGDSLPGSPAIIQASLSAGKTGSAPPEVMVVPPDTRRPGVIDTAVDSDNLNSIVLAHIPAGFLAGASFHAQGIQLAGDGVVIHLTRMTFNGQEYNVDAYALQDDTLQSSVSSDVNNRYFSRIILPAVASSLGGLGALYRDENTQILSTNAGTISGSTGKVSGSAVAGTIIGGIGSNAGQVLTSDAARLPVKQVHVWKNQTVAIQFMKGVYESDRVNPGAITPSVPALNRSTRP